MRVTAFFTLLVTQAWSPALLAQPEPRYEIAAAGNVMVAMRDGVKLATDIYRPARNGALVEGKFPVILERTPYNKEVGARSEFYLVSHGYVVVLQDVRGRYQSEGHWVPIRDDPNDGFDTAQWIGAQPWSDGNIGTMGSSYGGATQHALAIANAPYVKAMIPRNAMSDFGWYGVRHNGAFELRWLNWVLTLGNAAGTANAVPAALRAAADRASAAALVDMGNRVREYVRSLPLRPGTTPLKFAPDYEAWLVKAMSHGDYDSFWKNHGSSVVDHLAEYKDIPAYHTTGWYDSWGTQVANLNFVELRKAKKSLQRLIVGPWIHSSETISYAGEAQFTEDAALDLQAFQLRWFDHWLKGIDNGVDREPPVRIYVMGGGDAHKTPEGRIFVGGHWREEREWPLARSVPTPYYLHAGGVLSPAQPAAETRDGSGATTYLFDPRNPVPTLGGNVSSQGTLMFQGAADQRCRPDFWLCSDSKPLSTRNDILVFQTPPLAAALEVTGRLIVKLWAASNSPDTDFTAKLIDVYPPNADFPAGVDLNIADSIVRARYHGGLGKAELLKPGQPYEFTIEMYPTSLVFQKGHRIRIDISSSNFPRFDINPNTGEPLNDNRRWQIAENTVYTDAGHASRIVLPVVPQ
ncbi:MAG TPA: CocE/NonD family hydrolase [Candidatus Acidoferrales bacterium]|jgi:putative CocE/NonD family hydrolase|nr:CocE/NonD family hydrolase [Candidatus Acidoferrales bacterium]